MDRRFSPRRSTRARQRGAAIVEFAVTLTTMVTLLLGAAEVARAVRHYNAAVGAVAAAARFVSQRMPGDSVAIAEAKDIVVYGKRIAETGDQPLLPGLQRRHVTVCDSSNCGPGNDHSRQAVGVGTPVHLVTVAVNGWVFVPMASWILPAFTFGPISVTMVQGAG